MKIRMFLATLMCVFSSLSWAQNQNPKTLLILDIDDTLKITHVLDRKDSLKLGIRSDSYFLGTNLLTQRLQSENPRLQVHYVSNGFSWLTGDINQAMLHDNHFAPGLLYMRTSTGDATFKVRTIEALIDREQPEQVIMLGDNGENDTLTYAEIQAHYPELKILSAIHMVYAFSAGGKKLEKGQTYWVTSIDLAATLIEQGFLSAKALPWLADQTIMSLLGQSFDASTGPIAFPWWLNCSGIDGLPEPKIPSHLWWQPQFTSQMQVRCLHH